MTALKTLKQLKLDRRNFYSQIWADYNTLRKSIHKRIATEKDRLATEAAKLESQFITKAIKAAGTKQLSDKMILNDIHYDGLSRCHTTSAGGLHDYHTIALLRNGWKPEDHPAFGKGIKRGDYGERYLLIPERSLGEDCPVPDESKLETLEAHLEACDDFKLELQGKSQDIDMSFLEERSPYGSQTMTAIEMQEYYERVYPEKDPNVRMSVREAMAIMEEMQSTPANNAMSAVDMRKHIARQKGVPDGMVHHYGSDGKLTIEKAT